MLDASAPRFVFGFAPREISALVNHPVVSEHASEAAFLWTLHRQAVRAPHYTLDQLARLDERLLAHLAGLQVAGAAGARAAFDGLGGGEAGALFVASHLAFERRDLDGMRHVLALAPVDPRHARAVCDALAWIPLDQIDWSLQRLQQSPLALHRWIACAARSAHRAHTNSTLEFLLDDDDATVRAGALQAVGEHKLGELRPLLAAALRDDDAHCRFRAATSLALMGDTEAARTAFETGLASAELCDEAIQVGMRCGDPQWAREAIRVLAADPVRRRQALQAVGALGDPATMPWLLDQCADAQHAAVAGAAVTMLTGADLKLLDLATDAPAAAAPPDAADEHLPWPDAARVVAWWQAQAPRFAPGQRHLGGAPVSVAGAVQVLRTGFQRQRAAAAIELARLDAAQPLFAVGGRADWQLRRFPA